MTRKATFLARRAKYAAKYRRQHNKQFSTYKHRKNSSLAPGVRLIDPWLPQNPKQTPKRITTETNDSQEPRLKDIPGVLEVTGWEEGHPPHAKVIFEYPVWWVPGAGTRRALAYHGGHQRRRMYVGHKPGRLNGYQRRCWGAALVRFRTGAFPDNDPLQRRPNESDIAAGTHVPLPLWHWTE